MYYDIIYVITSSQIKKYNERHERDNEIIGEDIPLIARMICVADSFDAMNSNRVYRKKLTMDDIVEEIKKNKGKQFDPVIADTFLRLIRDGKIE